MTHTCAYHDIDHRDVETLIAESMVPRDICVAVRGVVYPVHSACHLILHDRLGREAP